MDYVNRYVVDSNRSIGTVRQVFQIQKGDHFWYGRVTYDEYDRLAVWDDSSTLSEYRAGIPPSSSESRTPRHQRIVYKDIPLDQLTILHTRPV